MAQRFTIAETEGSQRAYSYLLPSDQIIAPEVCLADGDASEEIKGELEALAQSDSAPAFLWEPSGSLVVSVEEVIS